MSIVKTRNQFVVEASCGIRDQKAPTRVEVRGGMQRAFKSLEIVAQRDLVTVTLE